MQTKSMVVYEYESRERGETEGGRETLICESPG